MDLIFTLSADEMAALRAELTTKDAKGVVTPPTDAEIGAFVLLNARANVVIPVVKRQQDYRIGVRADKLASVSDEDLAAIDVILAKTGVKPSTKV